LQATFSILAYTPTRRYADTASFLGRGSPAPCTESALGAAAPLVKDIECESEFEYD